MLSAGAAHSKGAGLPLFAYAVALLLATFTYFYGLGSDHIPKNGDEFPYAHVTRVTAASGHLLPLRAEIESLRNTKPPLLFWQGIASTNWARNWELWRLRYPSVIYTLLTAGMVFLLASKTSQTRETGCLAALIFLAFFSTYRYGRPFLTDAPDVFWLFLPFFVLLYWDAAAFESPVLVPVVLGLGIGLGLLYKSFALAVPVLAAVAWWYWQYRRYDVATFLTRDLLKIILMGCISLAVFLLWFVLDPDPRAILREFILKENAAKFDAGGGGYVRTLLWGGSSIWSLALGFPLDAGLLALPVAALFWFAWRGRAELSAAERRLWMWVIVIFAFFSLPSQRSERYLLPAMPAVAILCALSWERINRKLFVISHVAAGLVLGVLGYLSFRLQQGASTGAGVPDGQLYGAGFWVLLAGAAAFVVVCLLKPRLTRPGLSLAGVLLFLCFAAFLRPFDGPLGRYGKEAREYARGKDVWVPVNFKAKEEGYVFLLPGARVHPYTYDRSLTVAELSVRYPLCAVRLPMNTNTPAAGKIIGQRLDLGSRHTTAQIVEILKGRVFEHLFLKELLLEAPARR
ncbi:MAG TPA: phospholipid carrier-dependent glycosyltransferase [Candidatus Acidoferrum sp.]|nr:phospholipid carrier-dependent glycosyltransferase [Candidatus Acidoferrum sp.]